MRKLSVIIMTAGITAAMICGCGKQESTQPTTQAATAAETTAAETTTEAETTEAETEAEEEEEEVISSVTTVESDVFSISYPADLFEQSQDDDTLYFSYTGEAEHPVFLALSYYDGDPESEGDFLRGIEGRTIMVDDAMNVSFWPEEVSIIQQSADEDGYTAYYTTYFFPYGEGTMTVLAASYKEEDEETAGAFNDAMEALVNSLQFKTGEEDVDTETITNFENNVFSLSYPSDLFDNEVDEENTAEYFVYSGTAEHPVYLAISYRDGDNADDLADTARNAEGAEILVDETAKTSFWSEEIPIVQAAMDGDGYTYYDTAYFVPYLDGTLLVEAISYAEDDEEIAGAFNDAMENLVNTLQIKEAE